ncbi:MAG: nitrous oxide-stimulated promoter family protein [Peptococcaceae bacterium]|nr:nitrous oxide-stimulated promoter family protein [Peptococcaceae bacterium]
MNKQQREKHTIEKMIDIYCKAMHQPDKVRCEQCERLLQYSIQRIEKCIHGKDKPVCAKCKIHCYRPQMREEIKKVMRYAGPKMIFKHPILAIYHLLDSFRRQPETMKPQKNYKERT